MIINKNWLFLLFALCLSCNNNDEENSCEDLETVKIIDFTGLDGCSLLLERSSGDKLEPLNLSSFIENPTVGQEVKVKFDVETDMGSICMVGQIVTITCLEE